MNNLTETHLNLIKVSIYLVDNRITTRILDRPEIMENSQQEQGPYDVSMPSSSTQQEVTANQMILEMWPMKTLEINLDKVKTILNKYREL